MPGTASSARPERDAAEGRPEAGHGRRSWRLPAEPRSIGEVRTGVTEFARALGADDDVVAAIALAVSEAATNAVLHAFIDRPAGTLEVRAEAVRDALVVHVGDDGRGMQPRSDSPGLGLGLPTIGRVTERLDIRPGPRGEGTEIAMTFGAPGVRGPLVADDADGDRGFLLADVAALAHGRGWPSVGVEQLAARLVPRFADACTVDVLDEEDRPRRLCARVAGDEERSAWLTDRPSSVRDLQPERWAELECGRPIVMEFDQALLERISAGDEDHARLVALGARWWIVAPMHDGSRVLGLIGIGLGPERPEPTEADVELFRAVGERAAGGLANTRLVEELRRTRRRLERILAVLGEAVTVHDAEGRVVYANDAAARLLGARSVGEVLAAEPRELAGRFRITREDGSAVALEDFPGYRAIAGEPAPQLLTRSVHVASGVPRWLLTKATLLDDDERLAVNIIEDVTEAKEAELRHRFLARAGAVLGSSLDYRETLDQVARLAVPDLADWCGVDVLEDGGTRIARVALAHVDPDKVALGAAMQDRYPPDLRAREGLAQVLREGRSQLYPVITPQLLDLIAIDDEHLRMLTDIGMRSVLLVPMNGREGTMGVLTLVNAESGRTFDADDAAFAEEVASRAAVAVENARLYAERLQAPG